MFIVLEDFSYLAFGIAAVFLALSFTGRGGLERALRGLFLTAGVLVGVAFVTLTAVFGLDIEYCFEVAGS